MSDVFFTVNRRMFLKGMGGLSLAIPFLPSLVNAQPGSGPKRFFAIMNGHGACPEAYMYPTHNNPESQAYRGHTIRRSNLVLQNIGGQVTGGRGPNGNPLVDTITSMPGVSHAIRAPGLTQAMVNKINIIAGLDYNHHTGHHEGGHLGNFAGARFGLGDPRLDEYPMPTIDQVMAWSPNFYPTTPFRRSLGIADSGWFTFGYGNPAQKSGGIQHSSDANHDSLAVFDSLYRSDGGGDSNNGRRLVDNALASYHRLRAHPRLSSDDRRRLDEHIARLDELERRSQHVGQACSNIPRPRGNARDMDLRSDKQTNLSVQRDYMDFWIDALMPAFLCDTCRIFVWGFPFSLTDGLFSGFAGDWHQDIAHKIASNVNQSLQLVNSMQGTFQHLFLKLAQRLDSIDEGNGTALDNTLLMWTQESGAASHYGVSMPIVTAGSAGGYFRTGQYVDYRDTSTLFQIEDGVGLTPIYRGLVYNQWLGMVLRSMGVPPSEYAQHHDVMGDPDYRGGYGKLVSSPPGNGVDSRVYQHPSDVINNLDDDLPFLRA